MSTLNLTLLQHPLEWMDGEANLHYFGSLLQNIRQRDLIILPEMFTTGFAMEAAKSTLPQQQVIEWLHHYASRCNAMIGGSVAVSEPKGAVNRFLLVAPDGEVHHYDKRHLFRMAGEDQHYVAGKQRQVVEWRGWRILPQICYDLRFPVFSRNQNDYDLALYIANWPATRSQHWKALLMARAIENQVFVAGCNRVGSDANDCHYSGDSQIITPQGEIIAQTATCQIAQLDAVISLEQLHEYRQQFPAWRDADDFHW